MNESQILQNKKWIAKYKVLISEAYGEVNSQNSLYVIGKPFVVEPNVCCLETYLILGIFDNKQYAENTIVQKPFVHSDGYVVRGDTVEKRIPKAPKRKDGQ